MRIDKDDKKWEEERLYCVLPTFNFPRKGPEVGDTIEERMKRNLLPSQDKY